MVEDAIRKSVFSCVHVCKMHEPRHASTSLIYLHKCEMCVMVEAVHACTYVNDVCTTMANFAPARMYGHETRMFAVCNA